MDVIWDLCTLSINLVVNEWPHYQWNQLSTLVWICLIIVLFIIFLSTTIGISLLIDDSSYFIQQTISMIRKPLSFINLSIFNTIRQIRFDLLLCFIPVILLLFVSILMNQNLPEILMNHYNDQQYEVNLDRNDAQNVHNATITKYVTDALIQLCNKEPTDVVTVGSETISILTEIKQFLTHSTHRLSQNALHVVQQIELLGGTHSMSGYTEVQILCLVWRRIHHPINCAHFNDLLNVLIEQLNDCQDTNGHLLCLTGRITRIIQTLESLDAEKIVDLRPMWAIKEVIGEYCGRYTNKLLARCPVYYRNAFLSESRTPKQKKLVNQLRKCLRHNLDHKFDHMYIRKHILTTDQLNHLTQDYYHYLLAD